jgi:hypothetical protein
MNGDSDTVFIPNVSPKFIFRVMIDIKSLGVNVVKKIVLTKNAIKAASTDAIFVNFE